MTRSLRISAIALAVSVGWALPAQAQSADSAAIQKELEAMRAQIDKLANRVGTLEGQVQQEKARADAAEARAAQATAAPPAAAAPAQAAAAKPAPQITWEGAPKIATEDGWSFKPRGRIQYDAGWVSNPDDNPTLGGSTGAGQGLNTRDLGFNTRARRIRLGAEGTIPGGFGYKFEMDYANAGVGFGDVILTYAPKGKPWNWAIGNQETNNGLEQISSSRFLSFMERAAFDDTLARLAAIG